MKVAVIGAGPAGLVSARECVRKGCDVVVFEKGSSVGGVWVYSDETEADPSGQTRVSKVHSSLYESLRTNIPRDLMAFSDFTFDSKGGGDDRWPRFPHHSCVRYYLEKFAEHFDIEPLVRFDTPVVSVRREAGNWIVRTNVDSTDFDAVIVCNGHYTRPRVPDIAGLEYFSGQVIHSHNYRKPEDIEGRRIAIWGTAASGLDLAYETKADQVYWLGSLFNEPTLIDDVRSGYPSPSFIDVHGRIVCGGHSIEVDSLVFCTGYHYDFPFLEDEPVQVGDGWVSPLYRDLIPPQLPTLGFIGLPFQIIPFPVFEIQAMWFSRQLTGGFALPDRETMTAETMMRADSFERGGILPRHFHRMGDQQFEYYELLAGECGAPMLGDWFKETWRDVKQLREQHMVGYKDLPLQVRGPTVCLG